MKTIYCVLVALVLLVALMPSLEVTTYGGSRVNESLIVSTGWLAQHIKDDSLVLLQVGEKDEYLTGHIPGAQFITLTDISTPRGQGLVLELPSVDQLKATFERLGGSDKSRGGV